MVRIVGGGRAGASLAGALGEVGWSVPSFLGRGDDPAAAASGVDLVVIATPDAVIAEVAARIEPVPTTVVAHLAGSLGLEVLAPHERRGALHPLVSMPDAEVGARRLREGAWFAVAGDPLVRQVVDALGGRAFEVADADRALYHATACVASNHLVALMGQVERLSAEGGVPFDAFLALARRTLENVEALGPTAALTGPAARGDEATIRRHLEALDPSERAAYEAMADQARRLAAGR
jgi:predicted short-subunit dehydrogenase-like oxidoreductase (DUF2520 family)